MEGKASKICNPQNHNEKIKEYAQVGNIGEYMTAYLLPMGSWQWSKVEIIMAVISAQ